ncbi:hypothetical protein F2P44_30830 [Massilia sp. CCM 8695]|uniref:HEAT repeat domain-containing protein n=1 Tax=Massilia frigida TaxID=2609281 RepID=A0ABX0NJT5_9BURK|nr:hypothetical protein [Massilia frigida]NHZ83630.1 hypothetical protein [Massilia frigida]
MTSTEIPRIGHRLPPLAGLLDDTLDQALRARQRRVMMENSASGNLGALRVPDRALDRLLQTAALYGTDAARQLDAAIDSNTSDRKAAAVFFRIALAVQMHDPDFCNLAARFSGEFAKAVHDASWFYPVPVGPFSDNVEHIVSLFKVSADASELHKLAVELAGRRDVKALGDDISRLLDNDNLSKHAALALARMGHGSDAVRSIIREAVESDDTHGHKTAIDMLSADPRLASDAVLSLAITKDIEGSEIAWAISAYREPRRTFLHAMTLAPSRESLVLRVVAVTGYIEGIIRACATMSGAEGPISPEQADVLEITLGEVPEEARRVPNDRNAKTKALREIVLRVCRESHVAVCNDADLGGWNIDEILSNPEQTSEIRFRNGLPVKGEVPVLGKAVLEVTHATRQWFYTERAASGQHVFALSPFDVARRQELALMVSEFADEMRPK